MKINKIHLIIVLIALSSCNISENFARKKYNVSTIRTKTIVENPIYFDNGGHIKTNIFNKRRVEKERNIIKLDSTYRLAKKILVNQKSDLDKMESTHKISMVEKKRMECENKINLLYEELKSIDPTTKNGYKRSLEMLSEINDLFYNSIQPLEMIISKNKEVNELQGDFSFTVGSYKLTEKGINDISVFVNSIENDIINWKKYVNNYNNRIFSNEKFKLMIVIDGYADRQGPDEQNLILSKNRAEQVRNEFSKKINELAKSYKLVFDIKYFGKGETLPPGIEDNGKESDYRRRICRIMSVVGPASYME